MEATESAPQKTEPTVMITQMLHKISLFDKYRQETHDFLQAVGVTYYALELLGEGDI